MIRRRFQLKETIVTIIAEHECEIEAGISAIIHHRRELESYIMKDPFFSVTLEPYEPELDDAPLIVQKMVEASKKVGCGPMSAVAGTIAYLALSAMIEEGADHAIVDNGGDIALTTDRSVIVGIYAGNSPVRDLAFEVEPVEEVLGICTSSGTLGHSISFGMADAACVVSHDVALADAAATALGNAVTGERIEDAFSVIKDISEIDGGLIIHRERIALWGELPRLVKADVNPRLITGGINTCQGITI